MRASLEAYKSVPDKNFPSSRSLLPALALLVALIVRLIPAARLFLNPDEALHNLLASQSSISQAWSAALTNAHPPLLILLLYFWRAMYWRTLYWQTADQPELWLRIPLVLAGTAACWFFYKWLLLVVDRSAAFLGLLLACFVPALILVSAEIRQYALLLFFITTCLYLFERALQNSSPATMALFSLALYGALLTHYSALIFALTIGLYALARLYPYRNRRGLFVVWSLGQLGGVALATYFLATHIPRLRQSGMVRDDLESYLRKSIFHAGERDPVEFVATQSVRVFTYLFSHGLIGTLALLAFLAGIVWLIWQRPQSVRETKRPSPRQLALLLGSPFLVSWCVSLVGLYPLGATRHDLFLAPFALTGVCVGVTAYLRGRSQIAALVIIACLVVCNVFPAPPPPIRAKDQSKPLMKRAIAYLRTAPPGTVFFTDYESGLLLSYYLCGHGVVQIFPPAQPIARANCGSYTVMATSFHDWKFTADTFPGQFADVNNLLSPGAQVWLFYAGWINDSAPAMRRELAQVNCPAPAAFGENILICPLNTNKMKEQ